MTPLVTALSGRTRSHYHIVLIGLSLSLLFSAALVLKPSITYGVDGEVFYVGARLLVAGHNPYDARQLQDASREAVPEGVVVGTASQAQITPPALLAVGIPFCGLRWPWFQRLAVVADAFCIPLIACLCLQYLRKPPHPGLLWMSSFCVALFPPTWKVVAVGQITLLILLCVLGLLRAVRQKQPIPVALFCFLSLLKITCVLPLLLYLLLRETGRQRTALLAGIACFGLVNAVVIAHLGVRNFLHDYQQNIALVFSPGMVNDAYGPGQGVRIDLDGIIAAVFARHDGAVAKILLSVAALVPVFYGLRTARKTGLPEISSLCLLSLICFYHRPYDAVLIAPALFLLCQWSQEHESRSALLGLSLPILLCYLSLGDHNVVDPLLRGLHERRPAYLNAAVVLLTFLSVTLGSLPKKQRKGAHPAEEAELSLT